jgi:hypothetical protein
MPLSDSEQTRALNISTTGVCFATSLAVSVNEVVEVLIEIPKQVTGTLAIRRRFTGRIAHVDSQADLPGYSRIGVQLLYCEAVATLRMVTNLATRLEGAITKQGHATDS